MQYASYGLGIIYIVQLFLTIGGNSKFIPLTGVTLPLISYGGSSVLATLMMLSVVQGFYIHNDTSYENKEYDDKNIDTNNNFIHKLVAFAGMHLHTNVIAGVFVGLLLQSACIYSTMYITTVHR